MNVRLASQMGRELVGKTYADLAEECSRHLGRIWISAHSTLNNCEAQTPNITLYAVRSRDAADGRRAPPADALRCHVALTADVRPCYAGNEVARDTKVTNFDLPVRIDQNVGWLDVTMDDVVIVLESLQS